MGKASIIATYGVHYSGTNYNDNYVKLKGSGYLVTLCLIINFQFSVILDCLRTKIFWPNFELALIEKLK